MAQGYRTFQHWNKWLSQHLMGENLLNAETGVLTSLLDKHYGKHVILIGVPHQSELLSATSIPCHSMLSPLYSRENTLRSIESDFRELPILTGTIDLVMLPHTLELLDNPRQLLVEACRIVKPEGLIVIIGFNPLSAWGLYKVFTKKNEPPWIGNFIASRDIKNWLKLADFEMEQHRSILFRPPTKRQGLYKKLHFLEGVGKKFLPSLGGVYILLARAKVIPLTPIRWKWKQNLGAIKIKTSASGI